MLRCLLLLAAMTMSFASSAAGRPVDAGGLPATLEDPSGAGPLVVMVAGSGPTDSDGNSVLGVRAGYLRKLAGALAERGIASLRYDKRGLPGSAPAGDEADVTIATYVEDLRSVIGWAAAAYPGRPLVLLGHSEGGMVAIEAAKAAPDTFAGLVLLATPGRPPGETLRDQLSNLPQPGRAEALAILGELEAGRRVGAVPPTLAGLFRPSVQPFMISMLSLRPAETLAAVAMPALVVGGGTDIQVTRADFDALAQARPDVESRWFPAMNHVLADAPADFAGNVATYSDPDTALTSGLADAIAVFVRAVGE
ncbi:alpha/beta fold hydrolase [Aquibium sp. ELW1220]|uniref:alpha/beta hydrolase n=1 Tax=Aquibium sp. ELW1220 TaxID=2976766 RepID=UPI0025B2017D|nr:alpha/beta fold hydrolase [Aquibium sp. ELW1220]MDN2583745.1 lysophospholipase [Aquibium sp. ELW1220]